MAAKLDELSPAYVEVLHDRRSRTAEGHLSRGNIDHIVVAAAGVWVIDAKTHRGALQVRRSGGLFSERIEKLYIRGWDRTSLLDGLSRQVSAVAAQLAEVQAPAPVRGALCFVGTELPWFDQSIAGIPLVGRRELANLLKQRGDLGADAREVLAAYLATRFPPAT